MDFNKIINFMNQQLEPVKQLEELLEHTEKSAGNHKVAPEEIEVLRAHVVAIKRASNAAKALAEFYKGDKAKIDKPAEKETTESKTEHEQAEPAAEPEQIKQEPTEKPKMKRSSSTKPKEEPAAQEPEQPAPAPETQPLVPVAKPKQEQEPEKPVDIDALLAALTIDNLQG